MTKDADEVARIAKNLVVQHKNQPGCLSSCIAKALREAEAVGYRRGVVSEKFNKTYRVGIDLDVTMFADNHIEADNVRVLKLLNIRNQRGQEGGK